MHAERLIGTPSERDQRIALALTSQFGSIATTANMPLFGEIAGLSTRHMQRIYAQFCSTYCMDFSSWRDKRGRWRVQLAAVLLSRPELSQTDIAADVGYRSTPALARAFARAGLPSPGEVRRAYADSATLGSSSDLGA